MPHFVGQLAFALLLGTAGFFFARRIGTIRRNIQLGRDIDLTDRPKERWLTMARVAMGQSKMVVRPVAGVMHILIYVGFILINHHWIRFRNVQEPCPIQQVVELALATLHLN